MATQNQLLANRRNALLSTGPRSVEGKAASSRNALKTGLYSHAAIIPGKESSAEFDELAAAFTAEYQPATPTERALLDSLIHYEWLLRRYRWLEADVWRASLEGIREPQPVNSPWPGHVFGDTPAISRIHRLRNQTQRLFHETLAQLRQLQAERRAAAAAAPAHATAPQPVETTPASPENGFVSPNTAGGGIGFVPSTLPDGAPLPSAPPSPSDGVLTGPARIR